MNSPWAVGYKHGPSAHQYDTAQHDVISLWAYRSCQTTQVDLVRSDLVRFLSVKCQSCTLVRKDRVNISHWTPLICVWVFWSEKEGKALSHMGKWQALYWIYILTHFSQRDAREVLRSSPWKGIRVIRIFPSFFFPINMGGHHFWSKLPKFSFCGQHFLWKLQLLSSSMQKEPLTYWTLLYIITNKFIYFNFSSLILIKKKWISTYFYKHKILNIKI